MQTELSHPDNEGKMAKADLYRGAKHAMKLFQMLQDGQQLEGWVQAKITKAADYLDTVYHYMEYQAKFGDGAKAVSIDDMTGEAAIANDEVEEEDDEELGVKEGMTYEQRLNALLESKLKKSKK